MTDKRTQAHVALACAVLMGMTGTAFAQSQDEVDAAYTAATELLPPEARPGECYARVFIPGTEKRVANKVLVKEATEKLEVVPAIYEEVEEVVEIQSESEVLEIVPAKFETRLETVIVEPEREEQVVVDAVYEETEEKVKVREAYTTWKKGEGPIQRYDEATGEIMCLVTIPAEYKTVSKRVIKVPPRTITKVIPAVTEKVEVKVMVEPPTTRKKVIPAVSKTVMVRKLVEEADVRKIEIPAQYETVYEIQKEKRGQMEWRPILCSTNASVELIKRLQIALKEKGYNPGTADGVLGAGTMEAVRRYQRSKGIAQGQLTIEVMRDLGVDPGSNPET